MPECSYPELSLKDTSETDKRYIKAGSEGVALDSSGKDRITTDHGIRPLNPIRNTFEKNNGW